MPEGQSSGGVTTQRRSIVQRAGAFVRGASSRVGRFFRGR